MLTKAPDADGVHERHRQGGPGLARQPRASTSTARTSRRSTVTLDRGRRLTVHGGGRRAPPHRRPPSERRADSAGRPPIRVVLDGTRMLGPWTDRYATTRRVSSPVSRSWPARTGGPEGLAPARVDPGVARGPRLAPGIAGATLPVEVEQDEAGNIWAYLRGERARHARGRLAPRLGPQGRLARRRAGGDGRARAASGRWPTEGTPPCTVALVDWADEEGARFSRSLFGSAAVVGTLDLEVLRGLQRQGGRPARRRPPRTRRAHRRTRRLPDAASPMPRPTSRSTSNRVRCWSRSSSGIATVTGTVGIERERLIFTGQAAHAGTMPMGMRRDSFLAAQPLRPGARGDRRTLRRRGHGRLGAVLARGRHRSARARPGSRWTCATSTRAISPRCSPRPSEAARNAAQSEGCTVELRAHLPHPADALRSGPARRRPHLGAGGRRSRRSSCRRARCTMRRRSPGWCRR